MDLIRLPPPGTPGLRLRRAVADGDVALVRTLLDEGIDPSFRVHARGKSVLCTAAEQGFAEITDVLLEAGADATLTLGGGWSAATFADANEHFELAAYLVASGAPAGTQRAHGYTPLHRAARRDDVADELENLGTGNVDALDAQGSTPLGMAIASRCEQAASQLLRAGANPNFVDGDSFSLLCDAAYQDSNPRRPTHFVSLLLTAGAARNPAGYPPAFCTVNQEFTSAAVLAELVNAGTHINAINLYDGQQLLHRIAEIADGDMVDAALDLGADVEARDQAGRTPLHVAADNDNPETFARLVERGADVDAIDTHGRRAADLMPGA